MQLTVSEKNMPNVVVIGNGSWATAQMLLLTRNLENVSWFIRDAKMIDHIKRYKRNPRYLQTAKLDTDKIKMSCDINLLVNDADIIIIAVPSVFCKTILGEITCNISNKFIVSTTKGIIPDEHLTMSEYMNGQFNVPFSNICIVSGPCHAEEIALQRLSYLTFASKTSEAAETIAKLYAASFVRAVISTDVYGTEYGAILKNIYAVGVGICLGLGYGDNFISVFTANAHREMKRFLNESYPSKRNTSRSSYLGDLLVTCYSNFSRNRTFGILIGKGYSPEEAIAEMKMIAEGYYAARGIYEINLRLNISMPIAEAVYKILYTQASAAKQMEQVTEELR
ncbi:MAG: glycerol-3-phosphate dehydrogenase [Prevotellaceae bacterium]|jgi:glycerol-3-phosphate dehydrogenase (NAD(P)+)|nr:glycerol-3-phosphate dehydrogenase [Prevotellaceae bacterium]